MTVFKSINDTFHKYPMTSNTFTGFNTFFLGDAIAQCYEIKCSEGTKEFSLKHSLQIGVLGTILNGPLMLGWYGVLDKVFGASMTCHRTVFYKVAADQIVFAPMAIVAFFGYKCSLIHSDTQLITTSFQNQVYHQFWDTYLADCSLWPAANIVNFKYVSLVYRPSFTSMVQLLWQTYLSYVTNLHSKVHSRSHSHSQLHRSLNEGETNLDSLIATSNRK
jgi:protein Mpv17